MTWSAAAAAAMLWLATACPAVAQGSPAAPVAAKAPASPAPAASASAADRALALELATLGAPTTLMVESEARAFKQGFEAVLASQAKTATLFTQHPGLLPMLMAKMDPEVRRASLARLPAYRAMVAELLLARLSRGEMEGLRTFYNTPTGQKLIRGMFGNIEVGGAAVEMARSGASTIAPDAAERVIDAAKAKTLKTIDESDRAALMQLARSMPMSKLQAVGAEVQAASIAWGNKPDPEFNDRMTRLMTDEIKVYLAARKPKN